MARLLHAGYKFARELDGLRSYDRKRRKSEESEESPEREQHSQRQNSGTKYRLD